MTNISIELSSTEAKAMEYAVVSTQEWINHAAKNKARIAIDEICAILMTYCNENEIQMAVGKDAQVVQAFELGIVDTAINRQTAAEESSV